jgi:hypothetical protein
LEFDLEKSMCLNLESEPPYSSSRDGASITERPLAHSQTLRSIDSQRLRRVKNIAMRTVSRASVRRIQPLSKARLTGRFVCYLI